MNETTKDGLWIDYLLEDAYGKPLAVARDYFSSWNSFLMMREILNRVGLVKVVGGFYVQPYNAPPQVNEEEEDDCA